MTTRILYFAYGCLAYGLFLATFLYAIGFVGGFGVPTRLDGPAITAFWTALFVDTLLLGVFALQHSIMARRWFKRWWTQVVPWAIERSTYVLFASLAFDLLFWQWRPLWWKRVGYSSTHSASARLGGFHIRMAASACDDILHQPLRPVRATASMDTPDGTAVYARRVRHAGPQRFVRHPLYLGFLLAFWATPTMTVAHLVFAAATTVYIVVAIQFEERDLAQEHGSSYLAYRRRVPMLFPRLHERLATTTSAERATSRWV
jgi:protein-S-isoprenylcysteine O-methyltransferase Ste14